MSYIGKVELKASDIRTSGVITISGGATNTVALGGSAPSVQTVVLTVNGVTQATNTYTISGSTLTLSPITDFFADGDTVEAITINDIGTTITPADGTVTLQRLSPSTTGASGKYLTNDGTDLSWGTVASVPDLTTEGDLYKNYKEFTSDHTTPVDANSNSFLLGPIGVSAVGSVTWTIEGDVDIL